MTHSPAKPVANSPSTTPRLPTQRSAPPQAPTSSPRMRSSHRFVGHEHTVPGIVTQHDRDHGEKQSEAAATEHHTPPITLDLMASRGGARRPVLLFTS